MNKKKSSSGFMWIMITALLVMLVMFGFTEMGPNLDKLNPTVAITDIQSGNVEAIYAYNGEAKILLKEEKSKIKGDDRKKFPKKADYYFEYTGATLEKILDEIALYNNKSGLPADQKIVVENPPAQGSWIDIVFPLLYIGLGIFSIYFIFKMFAKSNNNAMQFGKNRARASTNVKDRFSDIAGAEEEKEELAEIVEFLKNPKKFTELGARIPKGVLLVGNPGTGKTLLARAVAGESSVPFLQISGSDFVEMFVGVGASRVRDLFEQAKKLQPCIVFIDEIDAVGRQRGAGLGGGNDEREQTLNQLLVEMDGFEANEGIIVLAATNRSDVLDPALLRPGRFDRQIYVHAPDVKGREGIIKIHARNKPLSDDIDFQTLARLTTGFTGADLENMLNEAAILAARNHRPKIIMQDITEGINKVIMGPQKKSLIMTDSDKLITAYHESGHAIIGKMLENCEDVQEVSIIPRGMAAGYTMSRPNSDDSHMGKQKLNDTIAMMMGGRLSEELFMKDVTTGASNDIKRATELARKMVTEWGLSDKFGFMSFSSGEEVFIGRDYQNKNEYSETTAAAIDAEVKKILDYNYKRAKEILVKNKDVVKQMAELLLAKNTIYKDEVDMILAGKTNEEISKIMDEKLEARKKEEQKIRKQQEKESKIKEVENRLKTAETYLKQGIISKQDYELIVNEKDKAIKKINDEYAEAEAVEEEQTTLVEENKNQEEVVVEVVESGEKTENNKNEETKIEENEKEIASIVDNLPKTKDNNEEENLNKEASKEKKDGKKE